MSLRVFYDILNQKGTPAFYTDTLANRPAFGYAGRVFISTDSGQIFEDTGSAWTLIADAGVGGGTLSSVCLNGNTTATGIVITAGGLSTNSVTNTGNTAGSVLFAGAGGLESQSNATFFWDNTNKRLGIGNATPGAPLDVHGTGTQIQVNGTGTNNSYIQFQNAGTSKWRIGNNYNAGANSFDIFNSVLSTSALSISNSTNALTINYSIFSELGMLIKNGTVLTATGYTGIGSTATSLLINLGNSGRTGTLTFQTGADYTYTFPASTGTLALTSNIPANIITGTGVANQVSLFTGTNTVIGASNLTFDNTNARMGVNASSFTLTAQLTSYSTTQSNQFKAAGTAPGYTFSDGTSTVTYGGAIGGATAANNFITGSAAGDICLTNQSLSAGAILFGIGTSEKMRLTASGSLAIGTSSPISGRILTLTATSGTYLAYANIGSGTRTYSTGVDNYGYVLYDDTAAAYRMVVNSSGSIGIGSSTIYNGGGWAKVLSLYDPTSIAITYATNTKQYQVGIAGANDDYRIYDFTGSTYRFAINGSTGNVLIGKTSDNGAKFQVYGNTRLTGTTNDSSATTIYCENNLAVDLFYVRNDGLFATGTATVSPYNYTTGSAANLFVNGSGHLLRSTSSLKYKKDIRNYDKGLDEVIKMRPVYYKGKGKDDGDKQYAGLIAEEVDELGLTEFVQYAEDGTPDALAYQNMIALLTKAIQELNIKLVRNNIN